MFPFLLLGGFFGSWLDDLIKKESVVSNNSYNPMKPNQVSKSLYEMHKWIEGYRTTTYKDSRGINTVGIGITTFSNGTKPQIGKSYDASYLESQYMIHIKSKTAMTINLLESWKLLQGYNQNVFDVICDMHFQGFSQYRKDEAKKKLQLGKSAFANWLLTPDGMWAQFWNPKNKSAYASRWGVLKRAYWRANWVMGINKTPQQCETWLKLFRENKAIMPSFI